MNCREYDLDKIARKLFDEGDKIKASEFFAPRETLLKKFQKRMSETSARAQRSSAPVC